MNTQNGQAIGRTRQAKQRVAKDVYDLLTSDYYKLWRAFSQLERGELQFTKPVLGDGWHYQFAIVKSDTAGDVILEKSVCLDDDSQCVPQYRLLDREQATKSESMFYRLSSMHKVAPVLSATIQAAIF